MLDKFMYLLKASQVLLFSIRIHTLNKAQCHWPSSSKSSMSYFITGCTDCCFQNCQWSSRWWQLPWSWPLVTLHQCIDKVDNLAGSLSKSRGWNIPCKSCFVWYQCSWLAICWSKHIPDTTLKAVMSSAFPAPFLTFHIPLQAAVSPKTFTIRSSPVVPPECYHGILGDTKQETFFQKAALGKTRSQWLCPALRSLSKCTHCSVFWLLKLTFFALSFCFLWLFCPEDGRVRKISTCTSASTMLPISDP